LVALQPGYLPWLGYFDQLARSDVFVHLDDVQYDKHGWRNRNRIRVPGEPGWIWLTVPVRTTGRFGARLNAMEIDNTSRWSRKHWRSIEQYYRRAPFYERYAPMLRDVYQRRWRWLVELDLALIGLLAEVLGLKRRTLRASCIELQRPESPSARLVDFCRHFGADEYLTGAAARSYLDQGAFEEAGIRVIFQDYCHPAYRQCHPDFVSHLSAIDLLFNAGPSSPEILRDARDPGFLATPP